MEYFSSVIGYEDIKAELARICDVLRKPEKYERLGVSIPYGVLLYGDHGMGKTLLAECFIRECGCPVFGIPKEEPGCNVADAIREAFAEARNAGSEAIVFLDNLDDDDDVNVYVALKACMDDCRKAGVFVLAAAKDKDDIPDCLLRPGRFDKVIELDRPDLEDTEKILKYYLAEKKCAADVDAREIAEIMQRHSCSDLEMVVNDAGIYAGFNGRNAITQEDLLRACMCLAFASPEKAGAVRERELLETAVHEAGHVVVSEVLDNGSVTVVSIGSHTGGYDGITLVSDVKISGRYKERIERQVIRGLAGRAASEIALGMVDVSCADDLERTFSRVERLVDDLCAFGFDAYESKNSSEALRAKKEGIIAEKMAAYYQTAKDILVNNRAFLDKVTEELMQHRILRKKDIKRIRGGQRVC